MSVLHRDFLPDLGPLPCHSITAKTLLGTLRKIEDRGALDALADARSYAGQIFRYAVATSRADRDVAADLRDAFRQHTPRNFAALKAEDLPCFLAALEAHSQAWMAQHALKLVLLTLVRTTELRAAKWTEFDFENRVWVIPGERMKTRRMLQENRDHVVPLSAQSLAVLSELRKKTGGGVYLFPNAAAGGFGGRGKRRKPFMSENTMLKARKDMGFAGKTTIHGFRSTGSTILHESGLFRSLVIETQLAHKDRNVIRGTYNKAKYLPERRELMQWWADYLSDQLIAARTRPVLWPRQPMDSVPAQSGLCQT